MLRTEKKIIPVGLAALSGLLLAISFPRWDVYPAAFIALVPLFFACENQSPKKSFLLGGLTGLIYFAGTLSWVTISMHYYGSLPWVVSYLIMLLLVAYLSVYVGLFTLLVTVLKKPLLVAPIAWTALEYFRGHLLTGFPWNLLGYSQYRNLPFIQIADITSVYGVSFLLVLTNVAIFLIVKTFLDKRAIAWPPILMTVPLLVIVFLYGFYRLSQPMDTNGNGQQTAPIAVGVVQGNIDQGIKWDPAARNETIKKYEQLSLSFVEQPDLVVWPESATPFFFQNEPFYQQRLYDLIRRGGFDLLFGSPAFQTGPTGQLALLNSAYLLRGSLPAGQVVGPAPRYDKVHLVPFGEYVPLKSSILFFVDKMVTGIGEFVPGRGAVVMDRGKAQIGTVICYEVIFPELVRQFAQNGANIMVTITNDAWFGDSAAPYQHFSMVVFRAIENRVPFARAANTGVSGFINAHGTILQATDIFVEDARLETLYTGFRKTPYTMYGDFFAIGCIIGLISLMGSSYRVFRAASSKSV